MSARGPAARTVLPPVLDFLVFLSDANENLRAVRHPSRASPLREIIAEIEANIRGFSSF